MFEFEKNYLYSIFSRKNNPFSIIKLILDTNWKNNKKISHLNLND